MGIVGPQVTGVLLEYTSRSARAGSVLVGSRMLHPRLRHPPRQASADVLHEDARIARLPVRTHRQRLTHPERLGKVVPKPAKQPMSDTVHALVTEELTDSGCADGLDVRDQVCRTSLVQVRFGYAMHRPALARVPGEGERLHSEELVRHPSDLVGTVVAMRDPHRVRPIADSYGRALRAEPADEILEVFVVVEEPHSLGLSQCRDWLEGELAGLRRCRRALAHRSGRVSHPQHYHEEKK